MPVLLGLSMMPALIILNNGRQIVGNFIRKLFYLGVAGEKTQFRCCLIESKLENKSTRVGPFFVLVSKVIYSSVVHVKCTLQIEAHK